MTRVSNRLYLHMWIRSAHMVGKLVCDTVAEVSPPCLAVYSLSLFFLKVATACIMSIDSVCMQRLFDYGHGSFWYPIISAIPRTYHRHISGQA